MNRRTLLRTLAGLPVAGVAAYLGWNLSQGRDESVPAPNIHAPLEDDPRIAAIDNLLTDIRANVREYVTAPFYVLDHTHGPVNALADDDCPQYWATPLPSWIHPKNVTTLSIIEAVRADKLRA